jgi:hypothetical protein
MSRLSDVQPLSKTYLDLVGDRFSVYHIVAERDRCDISASTMSTISAPDYTIYRPHTHAFLGELTVRTLPRDPPGEGGQETN